MEYCSVVERPKAKSKIWKYFGFPGDANGTITTSKKVVCKLCREQQRDITIPYSGNTSNLRYHVQREHRLELPETDEEPPREQSSNKPVQVTLQAAIARTAPFGKDTIRHCQLEEATANFICQSLQPVSIVDQPSFRRLLEIAEPRFQLAHRTYFTNTVIPNRYVEVRSIIEKQLSTVQNCTMTSDLWTAQHQYRSYISLTIHFVCTDFKLQSKCLQTLEIPQDHTAASLQEVLSDMFKAWSLSNKVCGATTDNCGNIVNAVGLLGLEHVPCVAHTLQLSIKRGLEIPAVNRVLARCRKLVEHFRKSSKETYKLRQKQTMLDLPEHKLIQEVVTRWGSTLGMLERLMEQQLAIAAVLIDGTARHLMPESGEWTLIEQLVEILKPFQVATEVMSGEKYPTVSTVKPLLYKLTEKTLALNDGDSSTIKAVKQAIKKDLESRYTKSAIQRLLNVSTYLDPRYKELPFLTDIAKRRMRDDVKDELLAMETSQTTQDSQLTQDKDEDPPSKRPKESPGAVSKLLGDLFKESTNVPLYSEIVSKEMELYKTEKLLELDGDPLQWWHKRQSIYPIMCKLVQKMFSFVATSVPSERLFSSAGNVITAKRSCLTPEHADQLIFLFENNC